MSAQRIRITEKGWGTYNGFLGTVEFVDGLSVDAVAPITARHIGSIVRIENCDSQEQGGASADLQRKMHTPAPTNVTVPQPDAPPAPAATVKVAHTRESLEATADAHGIAGLRAIADPMNVKGRGIMELISEILAAQPKSAG